MKQRLLKAYTGLGGRRDYPRIQLQGKWLKNLGFEPGDNLTISALPELESDGYAIVIRKKAEKA